MSVAIKPSYVDWTEEQESKVYNTLLMYFTNEVFKNHLDEYVIIRNAEALERILGLPYVSHDFPMLIMNCNTHLYLGQTNYFHYCFISESGEVILALTNNDDKETFIVL